VGRCLFREFRINRQPLAQLESFRLGPLPQFIQMRPRLFRIDKIRRQRRNSAPVVDAAIEQVGVVRIGKIRRRLNIHLRHQQARHGQRAQHFPRSGSGQCAIGVPGLARKFCTITS
jgi:hypothetical protein